MGAAPGMAGSRRPEADGVFLSTDEWGADYFVHMNNTGGPVDVWQIDGVDAGDLRDNGNGYFYLPGAIPVSRVTLVQRDLVGGDLHRAERGMA